MPDERTRIRDYAAQYQSDYGFEYHMVRARQQLILHLLAELRPRSVLEIGCGDDQLIEAAREADFAKWVIVEPSEAFASKAREVAVDEKRLSVVPGFFPDCAAELAAYTREGGYDLLICSSLLHEVADPVGMMDAARDLVNIGGWVHVNVPNAQSLHRRLARAMGLIGREEELSERNLKFGHHRVLDRAGLADLVQSVGLNPVQEGGYMLKPFTHQQMDLIPFLSNQLTEGLNILGSELPDLASEIYVNCQRSDH